MSTTESGEFLDRVNATPRKLGHNKLQMEIDTLNKDIEICKVASAQKEIKLDLFKKTISNLQDQLQEKVSQINELQSSLDNNPDSAQVHNLNLLLSDKENENGQLLSSVNDLLAKLKSCTLELDDVHNSLQNKSEIVTSQVSQINELKNTIDQQVRTISQLESENLALQQELHMKSNLVDNSQPELESLRQELAVYKSRIEEQVQQILESESELQKQLEYSQPPEISEDTASRVIGTTKKKVARGDPKKRR